MCKRLYLTDNSDLQIEPVIWAADVVPDQCVTARNVYVLQHALDRLDERLDSAETKGLRHLHLAISIDGPQAILPAEDGKWLVPYYCFDSKLGYLVVDALPDKILIISFLLLPMVGTPEGDRLADRIRLRPREITYLNLDQLSTFRTGDVARDPEMRQLFEDCGCGDLFKADMLGVETDSSNEQISELRRYLGFNDNFAFNAPTIASCAANESFL